MNIYVSETVISKQDDYVNFLVGISGYNRREAEIRRWEIDYQIKRRCTPILMKPSTSGTLSFKTVLQQQEIRRTETAKITKAALASINSVDGGQSTIENPEVDRTIRRETPKVGRNDPCPCGSGKKYKNCHGKNA